MSEQCCGTFWQRQGNWGHTVQCSRTAKIERNGKHYCHQHDPEAVKARREASERKWRRDMAIRHAAYDVDARRREIVELAREAAKQQASLDDLFAAVDRLEAAEEAKRKLESGDA